MMNNKTLITLILGLLLVFSCTQVFAEDGKTVFLSKIEAAADKDTVHVGDIIDYSVDIYLPQNAQLKMQSDMQDVLGDFEIKKFSEQSLSPKQNKQPQALSIRRNYKLAVYKTGEFAIPAHVVEYKTAEDSDWQKLISEPVSIKVESLLEEGTPDLIAKPLKPKIVIWRDFWGWVIAISIITIIILIPSK